MKLRIDDIGRGFLYVPALSQQSPPPPSHEGMRVTERLSRRAVRQLKGSVAKAEKMGYPMRTMMTFTVRQEERDAFEHGNFILGREMRRVLNALQEYYRRRGEPLMLYLWVAENVRNENPHVHLLTNHTVPRADFEAFATHVEGLWGHGYAHIERIRNPKQARRYLMKALAYTLKGQTGPDLLGQDKGQGRVIGNRYGIARAILPRYETIELHDCAEAAEELRWLQSVLGDEIEEYAPGIWKTPYGLAFEMGTDLNRMREVIDELEQKLERGDDDPEGRPLEPIA